MLSSIIEMNVRPLVVFIRIHPNSYLVMFFNKKLHMRVS